MCQGSAKDCNKDLALGIKETWKLLDHGLGAIAQTNSRMDVHGYAE